MAEPVTVDASSQPVAIDMKQQSYKGLLNQQAQKIYKQLPLYQTHNEGSEHQPKFRTTVWVDGVGYTSPNTFQQRKMAEMDASKVTLSAILHKLKNEASNLIREDKFYCKSILVEYAVRMNKPKPTYETIKLSDLVFRSTLVFDNASSTGDYCRSKKEAEQSAACAVILKYLDSESGNIMSEIINCKFKHKEIQIANIEVNGLTSDEVTKKPLTSAPLESCLVQGTIIPEISAPVQTPFAPIPSPPPNMLKPAPCLGKDENTPAMDLPLVFTRTNIPGISTQALASTTPVFTALGQTPTQALIQTTTVPTQIPIQVSLQTTPIPAQTPIQAPIQTTRVPAQTPNQAPIQTTTVSAETPIQAPIKTITVPTQTPIQAPIQTTTVPTQTPIQAPIQTTLVPTPTPTQEFTQTTPVPADLAQATLMNPPSSKKRNRKNRKNAQKRMRMDNQLAMSAISPGQVPTFSAQ